MSVEHEVEKEKISEKERIVFVGGKNIGYGILTYLVQTDDVLFIGSNPSDLENSWYMNVGGVADGLGIPYSTESINKNIEGLRIYRPDYLICAYYDRILKPEILSIPKYGCINIHMGLAEHYRGCYPTTFPIIDGRAIAGVTIHRMTPNMDDGDIYAQRIVKIDSSDTGKTLYDRCTIAGVELFRDMWPKIKSGQMSLRPQYATFDTSVHHRGDFPSHEMNREWDEGYLDKMIRALTFDPFPKPYFMDNGVKTEIVFEAKDYNGYKKYNG